MSEDSTAGLWGTSNTPRQPHAIGRRWLNGPAKTWLLIVSMLASVDGLVWVGTAGFARTSAYHLVTDLAPQEVWGWAMMVAGGLALSAVQFDGRPWAVEAARIALAIYAVVTFVVGMSIAAVTVPDSPSALSGTMKWWGVCFACLTALLGPRLTSSRRVSVLGWIGLGR